MVSEVKNKHRPFTTANANNLDRQRIRKIYDLILEIRTLRRGIRKNDEVWPRKMCTISTRSRRKSCWCIQRIYIYRSEKDNYNALVRKFKKFVQGKKDLAHERYIFNKRDQKEGETFLSFLTNTTSQARKCGFDHLKDNMTISAIS